MTQRYYTYGKYSCKAYKKVCGKGYEVGFTLGGNQIFVGNFIHAKEASAWWTMMNKEMHNFSRKYAAAPNAPVTWTCKFMSNYMYKCYYAYLDREFSKYQLGFTQAEGKKELRYSHFKKTHPEPTCPKPLLPTP